MQYPELTQKIKSIPSLIPIVNQLKTQGKIIVSNNGTYDLLHIGHIMGLIEAKRQGDILIVGINDDASVRAYKGEHRPINNEHIRAQMLAALNCIDYVFIFSESTPTSWLEKLRPQIHTNGAEYGEDCIEKPVVEAYGGKIHLLPMVSEYSTTQLIEKINALPPQTGQ